VLTLHRLVRFGRMSEAFDGEGARLYGGRWNSPGVRAVYTSGARSLALLETLVHLDTAAPLPDFSFVAIEIAPEDIATLPLNTAVDVRDLSKTRRLGDRWLRSAKELALAVPSVLIPEEFNYLLNPLHPRFPTLRRLPSTPFRLDQRLL
jgi:RES domain-containing protein